MYNERQNSERNKSIKKVTREDLEVLKTPTAFYGLLPKFSHQSRELCKGIIHNGGSIKSATSCVDVLDTVDASTLHCGAGGNGRDGEHCQDHHAIAHQHHQHRLVEASLGGREVGREIRGGNMYMYIHTF